MTQQLGNIRTGQTLHCYFESYNIFGCSARPKDDSPGTVRVYKDGGSTYTESGLTYDTDCFNQAGINRVTIDTSGDFYELGHDYALVLIGASFFTHPALGSPQIWKNLVLAEFSISNRQPDAETIADTLLDLYDAIDGKTLREALQAIAAKLVGETSGAGTGNETFKGLDGITDRVQVAVDAAGNRTNVIYDPE